MHNANQHHATIGCRVCGAGGGSYIYGALPKAKAEELLTTHNNGANAAGTFLFRKKGTDLTGNSMVLSVIYKGTPTHHLMTREAKGGDWTVNKHTCEGATNVKQVAALLRKKMPWWPVPLVHPVMKGGTTDDSSGGGETKKPKKSTSSDAGGDVGSSGDGEAKKPKKSGAKSPTWLRKDLTTKAAAQAAIEEHCHGDVDGKDGVFVVWPKPNSSGSAYVVSVVFKSKVSHHVAMETDEGTWAINKKPCGTSSSILALVKFLGKKRPFWPVPLSHGIGSTKQGVRGGGYCLYKALSRSSGHVYECVQWRVLPVQSTFCV